MTETVSQTVSQTEREPDPIQAMAAAARRAGKQLAAQSGEARAALLRALAQALEAPKNIATLLAANRADVEAAKLRANTHDPLSPALIARLGLSAAKLAGLADGLRQLAAMPELLGAVQMQRELDDGLVLERVSCPLGVLGVVFEARPDAVPQITGLALKSGNAVLLKGGSEAQRSNAALLEVIHAVLGAHGLDTACVTLLEDRAAFHGLLKCHDHVDLIIARGSGEFVQLVMDSTKIPVLGHAEGLCHLYVHADAEAERATAIAVDAKCSYPAACNAIETLLWHAEARETSWACLAALAKRGVELRGDPATIELAAGLPVQPASDADWDTEYGEMILAVRQVDSLDAALAHIEHHGSRHTAAIVCADESSASEAFVDGVDAACVFVNASTRFADGYRFGLGAEVGIATGKLHARGPVGVEGLLSYRWLLRGQGQIASSYGPGLRAFKHRDLITNR
ncbi:Gamma-glutamyl phosphate reductase [Enhygromyxa salina]|uniref:Gamma-glutamyl phosphate reductase n=1 Tax=Enhygromyxa salina TaxID=215803 RepID=A0A0C2CKY4_9BACT|nr:glutamate-5-semialdehyde dehydrogenase [Enhygromyxa salina]KIG11891.1 Gamma-glutamyl phosphate reductase [Enhygromyxa salina]